MWNGEVEDIKSYIFLIIHASVDIKPERRGKGGPLLIHFDGWTATYDYWAEEDSPDLHPLGFMDEVGHTLPRINKRLQEPNGRNGV